MTPSSLGRVWPPHQERSLKTCSRTVYGAWPLGSGELVLPLNLGAQPPLRANSRSTFVGSRVEGGDVAPVPYSEKSSQTVTTPGDLAPPTSSYRMPGGFCPRALGEERACLGRLADKEGWKVCRWLQGGGTGQNIQNF